LLEAHGPLDLPSPEYEHCSIGPLPVDTPDALRKIWPSFFTADHAAAQLSLISSLFTHRYDSADHLHLGDKPLVVLSADVGWDLSGPTGSFWPASFRPGRSLETIWRWPSWKLPLLTDG
jgi:hypothetical protein